MNEEGVAGKQRILFLLIVLYVVWGSGFLANRFSLESFPPFMLNGVRFLTAGVFLYILLRAKGEKRLGLRGWFDSFFVGTLLFTGGMGFVSVGQQWVASGLTATLLSTTPLWTMLFAGFFGKKPTSSEWAGLAVGITGVALLNVEKGISGNLYGTGIILSASVLWALGSVMNGRLKELEKPIASATEMIAGGVVLLILSLFLGERVHWPVTARAAMGMLHLTFLASVLGFVIYRFLLRNVRPTLATSYSLVNPITATVLGVLFGGESVSIISVVAMTVILSGVALVFKTRAVG